MKVNAKRRKAWLNDQPLDLTDKEFDLLHALIRNAGRVVSYQQLTEKIWPEAPPAWSRDAIAHHLKSLRRKLGEGPEQSPVITGVFGRGVRFERKAPGANQGNDLVVDLRARRVWVNGEEVHLRAKEFDLLCALVRRTGRVVSREQLWKAVWPTKAGAPSHTLEVTLSSLRHKLGDNAQAPQFIANVRGRGWRLEPTVRARTTRRRAP